MSFRIGHMYNSKTLFECTVNTQGESYLIIYGEHINGNFCCIPNRGWGCEMAEASDTWYNKNQLMQCGADVAVAQDIAEAIQQASLSLKQNAVEAIDYTAMQMSEKNLSANKKVFVVFNGDTVYFADHPNSSIQEELTPAENTEYDSPQKYIKGIAKAHPEYSAYIDSHLDELCNAWEQAQKSASEEAISVRLARLEADMYAGGGYGDDAANGRAEHEISVLRESLGYENTIDFTGIQLG